MAANTLVLQPGMVLTISVPMGGQTLINDN